MQSFSDFSRIAEWHQKVQVLTEGAKGIHDEVDPEQLQHIEGRLARGDGCDEGHDQRHKVDGQLELQELADVAEDRAAPQHRLDNGGEVVIQDDNVCGLLSHLSA